MKRNGSCTETFVSQVFNDLEIGIVHNGGLQLYHLAMFRSLVKQIILKRPYVTGETHNHFFADRIDGGIGHLSE